jgi:hypothetical protein
MMRARVAFQGLTVATMLASSMFVLKEKTAAAEAEEAAAAKKWKWGLPLSLFLDPRPFSSSSRVLWELGFQCFYSPVECGLPPTRRFCVLL